MKRILCRAFSGELEPSKVAALFCFLNSPCHQFAEAFAYLSGVLSPFHSSICSRTCELSATEHRQAGQSSPIPYGQQSASPTCTQRRHNKAAKATLAVRCPLSNYRLYSHINVSIFNSYATLFRLSICRLNYSWMATQSAKNSKV